jgi:hypothetical protein
MADLKQDIISTPEGMRIWQQERVIFDVSERICQLMDETGINRTELAKTLGKSTGHLSQLLDGTANMTIRTMTDLFFGLGRAVKIADCPIGQSVEPSNEVHFTSRWISDQIPSRSTTRVTSYVGGLPV